MDVQVQEIIQKIREDGVKDAENRAKEIISSAEKQASERLDNAKKQAEKIVSDAEQETQRMKQAGEASLAQAGRDLVLAVRQEVTELFERVIRSQVADALNPDTVGTIIAGLVEAWSKTGEESFEALVPEDQRDAIRKTMLDKLAKRLSDVIELRPVKTIATGFQIGARDGSAHYDFSDQAVAEMLAQYLNPHLAHLLTTQDQKSAE
jgi:V/A-type H+-transporting ATPase subunit E